MRITKEYLLQMIREEVEQEQAQAEEQPGAEDLETSAGGKEQADVKKVLTYISKIDNKRELAQVLMAVVQHGQKVSGSKAIFTKLYKQLPKMIKGGQ